MKRTFVGLIIALICISPAALGAGLTEQIHGLIQEKEFAKAEMGIEVLSFGDKSADTQILFRHNSDLPLKPASNLKLVTTSAALERLGPNFKFRTVLARRGDDLILIGDGDPTLGDAEAMKRVGWETTTVFKQWAELLKKQGITSAANVYVDDSIFDEVFFHPHWDPKELLKDYRAEVAGLCLNLNVLDFYITPTSPGQLVQFRTDPPTHYATITNQCASGGDSGAWISRGPQDNNMVIHGATNQANTDPISIPIHDPPLYVGTVLAETLKAGGINITGKVARDRTIRVQLLKSPATPSTQPQLQVLAVYETPIENVISRANKDSINLYAECLCKRIGAAATGESGSTANGTAVMKDFVGKSVGIADNEFMFDDGCGLSRENGVSANAICRILEHDYFGPNRDAFVASLAIGGVDGKTLKKRFTDDLRGRVLAKTGYIRGVSCLSGLLKSKDNRMFAFSILINDIYTDDARKLQDRIVKAIDQDSGAASNTTGNTAANTTH